MPAHLASSAEFFGSQIGGETERPLAYTGSPWHLFTNDIKLFFRNILYLPCIFLPLFPYPTGPLDELYPTLANLRDLALHYVLFVIQLGFLISLPFIAYLPLSLFILYVGVVLGLNVLVCRLLNGGIPEDGLKSTEDHFSRTWEPHDDEYWIFLNGICVGKHWLQNNVDRLSRTFHRPVVGVHNKTSGVVFDLVQCLIQRSLLYATPDIRECYVLVKKALYRRGIKKVILILHSQGGIEGGMILDWLLNEVPQDLLQNLEVYTFGCIANHFNNPYRDSTSSAAATAYSANNILSPQILHRRAISHVEHYANAYDFASRWGVLHYTRTMPKDRLENRFMGRVFVNPRAGHQFNQHYLGTIFPLDPTRRFTRDPEEGDFMAMNVLMGRSGGNRVEREGPMQSLYETGLMNSLEGEGSGGAPKEPGASAEMLNVTPTSPLNTRNPNFNMTNGEYGSGSVTGLKMWELSRLWLYRNGGSPPS
ncbi:hypothetical protein ACJZ2D_012238 [Fusarium nematophilum]